MGDTICLACERLKRDGVDLPCYEHVLSLGAFSSAPTPSVTMADIRRTMMKLGLFGPPRRQT